MPMSIPAAAIPSERWIDIFFIRLFFYVSYSLPFEFVHFQYFLFRFVHLSGRHLVTHAVTQMIFQEDILDAGEALFDCRRLRDDIDAVRVVFDHALETANLPLNELEAPQDIFLL